MHLDSFIGTSLVVSDSASKRRTVILLPTLVYSSIVLQRASLSPLLNLWHLKKKKKLVLSKEEGTPTNWDAVAA